MCVCVAGLLIEGRWMGEVLIWIAPISETSIINTPLQRKPTDQTLTFRRKDTNVFASVHEE